MSTVTADQVKRLRDLTGAGLMDCKKALEEAAGDIDKAIEILRKKGHKMAAARQERDAREGAIFAAVSPDRKEGQLVLLACETDFVARNEDFRTFGRKIAETALQQGISDASQLASISIEGTALSDKLAELTAKIGEKMEVSRWAKLSGDYVSAYIHLGGRIGVLVALSGTQDIAPTVLEEVAQNVAMQIAALSPISVDRHSVPADVLEREKAIAREQARAEGKPENILEKIATGKLEKFFKEAVLLEQEYFKDDKKSVADYLKSVSPKLIVKGFVRLQVGGK
ncbi:MAG: translation elongation factor Ts [Bacteroidia bacterium]|nr:translation elongation factor Ts [Bacteroidia bacterium]MDW8235300.1 translation elongation factor Ts [Bacteroidia bacterium]